MGGIYTCPECNGPLEGEYHTYYLVIRQRGKLYPFVIGGPGGYFCSTCPVVVLDDVEMKYHADRAPGLFTKRT